MATELEIWKTVAAKLAFMITNDEGTAATVLAACVDQERKHATCPHGLHFNGYYCDDCGRNIDTEKGANDEV